MGGRSDVGSLLTVLTCQAAPGTGLLTFKLMWQAVFLCLYGQRCQC